MFPLTLKGYETKERTMSNKKYELTDETKDIGFILRRIRALRDIPKFSVKAGDLGGWIETEQNLSQDGDAWVSGEAMVYGHAMVFANAKVNGNARVFGEARVNGNAWVAGSAWVYGNAIVTDRAIVTGYAMVTGRAKVSDDVTVSGNAMVRGDAIVNCNEGYVTFKDSWSSGRWITYTCSNKMWWVGDFYGLGDELIRKGYDDSEVSGKCYEAIVRSVEAIEKAKE